MEKLPHYHFSWMVSFQKQRYHICENCLLKQVIEEKIKGEMEVTKRRGRRRKKLLDDLKDKRGYSHLKEEALYLHTLITSTLCTNTNITIILRSVHSRDKNLSLVCVRSRCRGRPASC